jgi:hypothetical protein
VKPLKTIVGLGFLLALPCAAAAQQTVFISEVLVGNDKVYCDSFGDDPDWIELYNPTDKPINLGGWSLTDDPGERPQRWQFPASAVIAPRGYLVVFARNRKNRGAGTQDLHTTFRLDAKVGEVVALSNPSKVEVHRIRFGKQSRDVSLGTSDRLEPATPLKWPTPGAANDSARPPSRCK